LTESYFDTLKRHGLKLSVAMFLGGLLYSAFYYVVLILYVIVAFLLIAIFSSASYILEGDTDQLADNLASEPGGMVLIAVLILLFFVTLLLPHSFWTAGAYGAASASVFRGEWSIGYFFTTGFRHLWKMFGQQILLILFFIGPALLMLPFISFLAVNGGSEVVLLIFLLLFFILLFVLSIGYLWISLHSPLIMIAERTGVWDSIRLAFRLTVKKPGQTLLSGLIALGISLGAYGLVLPIVFVLFILFDVLTGGNEIVRVILGIFLLLTILFVAYYALSASLLSIAHRYKTRLRSYLFPEDPDRERAFVGTTPGYAPNNW
jgi:hypothetical protein